MRREHVSSICSMDTDIASRLRLALEDNEETPGDVAEAAKALLDFVNQPLVALAALGRRIEDLEAEVEKGNARAEELNDRLRSARAAWSLPVKLDNDGGLPVPRLELRIEQTDSDRDGYTWQWRYMLVHRHFRGDLVGVTLSITQTTGGGVPMRGDKLDLPFRDGAHIRHDAATLNLPAFVTYKDRAEKIESKRSPLPAT